MQLLLIDYNSSSLQVFQDVFETWGFQVTSCSDGSQLKRLINNRSFDAVLTELELPGLKHTKLIPWLREKLPDSAMIVLTDKYSVQSALFALRNGVDDFIQKPFEVEFLKMRLLDLLDRKHTKNAALLESSYSAIQHSFQHALNDMKKFKRNLKFWGSIHRTSYEHISEAILILDRDAAIILVNQKMMNLLGLEDKNVIGMPLFTCMPGLKNTILYSLFTKTLTRCKEQVISGIEFRRQTDQHLFSLKLKIVPIKPDAGKKHPSGTIIIVYGIQDLSAKQNKTGTNETN